MDKIKNLQKLAQRLKKAIKEKEKISLFGDADPDGISSVIILKETLQTLGKKINAVCFPDREKEGYGLNENALNFLKKQAPGLLILLDCGISNFEEIKKAKKIGFETIVIDHHEVLDQIPKDASIVVDPKQKGDKYPFKGLATAGIVFKLAELLLEKKFSFVQRQNFLELVALATLADMMPKENENKVFLEEGLSSLEKSFRPAFQVFFEIFQKEGILERQKIVSKIIGALNAGKAKDHLNETYLLLTSQDQKEAKILAHLLIERSLERKKRVEEMVLKIKEKILKNPPQEIIFEGSKNLQISLLGPVASKICQFSKKPTFIYAQGKELSVGTLRMPNKKNGILALKNCAHFLKTFGGHPQAGGFSLKNENLKKFKECLLKYFQNL